MARRPRPTLTDEAAPVYEAGLEVVAAGAVELPAAVAVPLARITDAVPVAMGATGVTLTELETGAAAALETTEATEDETALDAGAAEAEPAAEPAAAPARLGQIWRVAAAVFCWSAAEQEVLVQAAMEETKLELAHRHFTSVATQPVGPIAVKAQETWTLLVLVVFQMLRGNEDTYSAAREESGEGSGILGKSGSNQGGSGKGNNGGRLHFEGYNRVGWKK